MLADSETTRNSRVSAPLDLITTGSSYIRLWSTLWNQPSSLSERAASEHSGLKYIDLRSAPWGRFGKLRLLQNLLIREEYHELVEYIETTTPPSRPFAISLAGQPGIG